MKTNIFFPRPVAAIATTSTMLHRKIADLSTNSRCTSPTLLNALCTTNIDHVSAVNNHRVNVNARHIIPLAIDSARKQSSFAEKRLHKQGTPSIVIRTNAS